MPPTFAHGVASGDPLQDRVIIWTRVTTDEPSVEVSWRVTRDPALTDVVAEGVAVAAAAHDHTVHVDVGGLEPGTAYHYGFEHGGERSTVGRTRTLPGDDVERIRFAMCSCAKFNAGFFNAYTRMAARDDLAFVLHLGDYIYEASNTPPASQTPGADIGRPFDPLHECMTLADYRRRYAQYRSDPDVQAVHAALPFVPMVDDHEFADGAWRGGAQEHVDERDGPWEVRKAAAWQVHWEWLPARLPDPSDPSRVFRSIRLGALADLFLVDIRSRRDQPVAPPAMLDPGRTLLGDEQRDWLLGALDRSGGPWRLVANPSVMCQTSTVVLPEEVRVAFHKLKLLDDAGTGPDFDQWDGYPVERALVLGHLRERGIDDVVVLSGDIHVSMAAEVHVNGLDDGSEPVAVEFVTASLTSQNLDDKLGYAPRTTSLVAERLACEVLPHLQWCDFDSHGYMVIDVNEERVRGEWWHVATVLERSDEERCGGAFEVVRGRAALVPAAP
jgi:alkaline phosphatase D